MLQRDNGRHHPFVQRSSGRCPKGLAMLVPLAVLGLAGCAKDEKPSPIVQNPDYQRADWDYGRNGGASLVSDHYEIYTTIRDADLQRSLPQVMESAYRRYGELVPPAHDPAEKMKVYVFASRGEFERFTRQFAGPRAQILLKVRGGGYSEQGVTVIEYVLHETTVPILLHEGFHQYLHHCVRPEVPAWINEGLAVYCEGNRTGGDGIASFDPWYNPLRRNALAELLVRDKELFPLEELLRMNAAHVVGGSARKIDAYYAQCWALTLFLSEGENGKYAASLRRMLDGLASGEAEAHAAGAHATGSQPVFNAGEALFRAYISEDIEAVEREYQAFLRQRILGA